MPAANYSERCPLPNATAPTGPAGWGPQTKNISQHTPTESVKTHLTP